MLKKFKRFIINFGSAKKEFPQKQVNFLNQEFLVRGLAVEDVKQLLDLEREIYHGELPWKKSAFTSEIRSRIPHLYLGLFDKNDLVIAFIGCRVIGSDAHITNFAVKPKFQKAGIGTFLMIEVEKFAVEYRCETMSLEVRMGNKDAQRLYRKLGFVSQRIRKKYYNETNEDALAMIKYLQ
ncbi:ribosomal-protein-alanine N-acetyltransferase [Enterococcus sp. PF1-24]|uniref:ribosomal protein S18-alanine N-acetyltransferase n=1 Tax=unclassified Enterococcus TaxID=2608891 RepID=UPI002475B9E0|nr:MULTISPECIES: ribosomal protein S18-alanine N-acetyltransferase [unclassified Enterococcus]MDH6364968.1 ribosomal-protein-alanine N-acetyltransferase [Enterococcus sp. PFB1-1]MDH6402069.1 ribosomal-protein-alanine N-acetyltransferase [Enterococcus sp. PF1-24]